MEELMSSGSDSYDSGDSDLSLSSWTLLALSPHKEGDDDVKPCTVDATVASSRNRGVTADLGEEGTVAQLGIGSGTSESGVGAPDTTATGQLKVKKGRVNLCSQPTTINFLYRRWRQPSHCQRNT